MELPEFPEAVDRFKALLKKEGLNADLIWLFREDVRFEGKKILIDAPNDDWFSVWEDTNKWNSEVRYEYGRQRNLGLEIAVYCFLNSRPACYIWLPKDDKQAQYRMVGKSSLKLTIPISRRVTAKFVNPFRLILYSLLYRANNNPSFREDLPLKTRIPNQAQERIENITILLRSGCDALWARLRELIIEKGYDPQTALLVDCFSDDTSFEYGILISDSKKIFQFGFNYLHKSIQEGIFSEWNDITESFQNEPEHSQISLALGMVPFPLSADLVGMFTES